MRTQHDVSTDRLTERNRTCHTNTQPLVVKFFSTSVEIPCTLSEMQTSILFKLALARMTNTAVYVNCG